MTVAKQWQYDLTIIKYLQNLKPDSRSDLRPRWSSTGRCSWFLPRWSGGHLRTAKVPADIRNPALHTGRPENRHSSCRNPKQRLNNCQKLISVFKRWPTLPVCSLRFHLLPPLCTLCRPTGRGLQNHCWSTNPRDRWSRTTRHGSASLNPEWPMVARQQRTDWNKNYTFKNNKAPSLPQC